MTGDYDRIVGQKMMATYLDRVEKIERAGAGSIPKPAEKLATLRLLDELFEMIRKDPPTAYVKLMRAALGQPSSVKPEYVNRIALLGRLSGYALLVCMQSEAIFNRVMAINEKPTPTTEVTP